MPNYLSPVAAAKRLEVDRRTVYRWLDAGDLRAVRVGGRWRIAEDDLDLFVVANAPTTGHADPVAHFDANLRDFIRWTDAMLYAARSAAAATGGRDEPAMDRILDAARALRVSLTAWQELDREDRGGHPDNGRAGSRGA